MRFLPFFILNDVFLYFLKKLLFTLFFIDKTDIRLDSIKKITKRIENSNIVYIKIFQTLCLEKNLLTENEKNFLIKYTDNVPYKDNEIDINYLETVCKEYNIILNSKTPYNSGIIAVVFKGKIENREFSDVVLKLKKNNIHEKYNTAFNNLLKAVDYTKYIPFIKHFQIGKLLKDCKENTLLQTDFINESENLTQISNQIDYYEEFRVPKCFQEITNKFNNIIVMEDITGLKINDILVMSDEIKYNFAKLCIKFGICCQLNFGILNSDLHAGNAFFYLNYDENGIPIYKIGIIDFGLSFKLTTDTQKRDFKFLYNMFTLHDFSDSEEIIISWLENPDKWYNLDQKAKDKCIQQLCNNILNCKNMDLDFLYSTAKLFNQNKLSLSKEFNNLILSLSISRSVGSILTDDLVKITKEIMYSFKNINDVLKID